MDVAGDDKGWWEPGPEVHFSVPATTVKIGSVHYIVNRTVRALVDRAVRCTDLMEDYAKMAAEFGEAENAREAELLAIIARMRDMGRAIRCDIELGPPRSGA